jgi:hypothetical protein
MGFNWAFKGLKYGRKDETNKMIAVFLRNREITLTAVKPPFPGPNPGTGFLEI